MIRKQLDAPEVVSAPAVAPMQPLPMPMGRRQVKEPLSKALFLLGVAITIATVAIVVAMFAGRPVTSEEDELIGTVTASMKQAEKEWLTPEVMSKDTTLSVGEADFALSLYRLRLFIFVDLHKSDSADRLDTFLTTLRAAHYDNRSFPIDIEVRIPATASGALSDDERSRHSFVSVVQLLADTPWHHGRCTVTPLRVPQGGEVLSPTSLWLPLSDWELAAFVDVSQGEKAPALSVAWFTWLEHALHKYGTASSEGFRALGRADHIVAGERHRFSQPVAERGPTQGGRVGAAVRPATKDGEGWQTLWYEPLRSPIGKNAIPASLLGFSLGIPSPFGSANEAEAAGAVPGSRVSETTDFVAWSREQAVNGPAYLAQRPGLLLNIFFPAPWREVSAAWDFLSPKTQRGGRASAFHLPVHSPAFQAWMKASKRSMLFPFQTDGTYLLTSHARHPRSVTVWNKRPVEFPDFAKLDSFDEHLRRI